MKFCAVCVLCLLFVGAALANKDEDGGRKDHDNRDQRVDEKEKHQRFMEKKLRVLHVDEGVVNSSDDHKGGDYDIVGLADPVEYKGESKTHTLKHPFGQKLHKKSKKKNGAGRKMKKIHQAMAWLDLRSDFDCEFNCKEDEVCISGPVVSKPICVQKKDLKKSMKMFHRYHKKEMKEWKNYQKEHYKQDWKLKGEKYGKKDNKFNKDNLTKKEKKAMKLNKQEMAALRKEKREKLAKKHNFAMKFHKKAKPHHNVHPKNKETVCGRKEMTEMKSRMVGWFHLLHGQDHQARKAHRGSIGKFYKHVSAKKELREHNGEKCQCMKSAMWQFHQMDKDQNDILVDDELTMLEENTLEPCMGPYLDSCDRDGDKKISSDEWCCCFTNVLPPCYKHMNDIRKAGQPVDYMPRCDKEGYYMHEQCKGGDSNFPLTCWCVDYNGNEFTDTVKEGRAHCHHIAKYGAKQETPLA